MQVSLNIKDSKAAAFLNFIKSLDFITDINETSGFSLNDTHKNILDNRKESFLNGDSKTSTWDDVKANARKEQ